MSNVDGPGANLAAETLTGSAALPADPGAAAGTAEALAAVDAIITHFGNHERDAYFAGFAPEATFLFYTTPNRVESRAAYEKLWDEWETEAGFHVLSCSSSNRRIQVFGTTAVFSHDVDTTLTMDGATESVAERESIILELRDGHWLGIHEHLSARG
jgi:ketosteroid isomerase-like protein